MVIISNPSNDADSRSSSTNRKFGQGAKKLRMQGHGQRDNRDDSRRKGRPEVYGQTLPSRRDAYVDDSHPEKVKRQKSTHKVVKKANPDVFIPSVVSVGNLAKLLNVRLGLSSLTQA